MKNKLKENYCKSVIFDFDFTLADSSKGIIDSVSYAFSKMNLKIPSSAEIQNSIGLSLLETFRILGGGKDFDRFNEFRKLFINRADQVMLRNIIVYDSVKPTLTMLHGKGMTFGIVSNKFRYRIEEVLKRDGLEDIFQVIIGHEDIEIEYQKPNPLGLMMAMEKLNRLPSEVIYVGDSTIDAETAQRAKISFVAVLSGLTKRKTFEGYKRLSIIKNLMSLPKVIKYGSSPIDK